MVQAGAGGDKGMKCKEVLSLTKLPLNKIAPCSAAVYVPPVMAGGTAHCKMHIFQYQVFVYL